MWLTGRGLELVKYVLVADPYYSRRVGRLGITENEIRERIVGALVSVKGIIDRKRITLSSDLLNLVTPDGLKFDSGDIVLADGSKLLYARLVVRIDAVPWTKAERNDLVEAAMRTLLEADKEAEEKLRNENELRQPLKDLLKSQGITPTSRQIRSLYNKLMEHPDFAGYEYKLERGQHRKRR
jgi:hypothetical protein